MNAIVRNMLIVAGLTVTAQASAQVTFYEHDGFSGRTFTTDRQVNNFNNNGYNDRASSVVVVRDQWEVCDDANYDGRCVVLRPGRYPSLSAMRLNDRISSVRRVDRNTRIDDGRYAPAFVSAQVTFYEYDGFGGRSFTSNNEVRNFKRAGFNDRASSVIVLGDRFEVCEDARFSGRCVILRPGRYASLSAMGLNDRVSSVRTVGWNTRIDDDRYSPPPVAVYDNRRRNSERLYEADITSVRAVVGRAEQRCWIEREQVSQDRGDANVGGAIAGALIGGILGHQVGGGRGKDAATAGGAVVGALVGANAGRDGGGQYSQDVQRCSSTPSQSRPDYWDVTYEFRGQEHRIQMTVPPGRTITVNEQGEPRA